MIAIAIKRIYLPAAASDGCRVLVDRLWPRGIKKSAARLDHWFKALAPSDDLRHWFGHDPERWDEFHRRYRVELDANPTAVTPLRELLSTQHSITLLFAARDESHNNAVVLADYLRGGTAHD